MRVNQKRNSPESETIKLLLKEIVYGGHGVFLNDRLSSDKLDWESLIDILKYHELLSFFYCVAKGTEHGIPQDKFTFLKNHYYLQLARYLALKQELCSILRSAGESGITLVPIKGFSYAEEYYRKFNLRPAIDIDLLAKDDLFSAAAGILGKMGYAKYLHGGSKEYWRDSHCHMEFIKPAAEPPIMVELHWNLDIKRDGHDVLPGIWERLRETEIDGTKAWVLSPEDSLFSLALHQRRFGKMLNLKYVCDTGMIIKNERIDWEYIIDRSFKERIRASLYFLLRQTELNLGIDLACHTDRLRLSGPHKKLIDTAILKHIYSAVRKERIKSTYILCHFLLYDDILYPVKYAVNIPLEQFAKFYDLPLYSAKTAILYSLRWAFVPWRLFCSLLKNGMKHFVRHG